MHPRFHCKVCVGCAPQVLLAACVCGAPQVLPCSLCLLCTPCFTVKSVFVVHLRFYCMFCCQVCVCYALHPRFYCQVCVCCALHPRFYYEVCVCCAPQGPWLELWKRCLPSLCPEMPTCNVGVCQTGVVSTRTPGLMSAPCSDADTTHLMSTQCSDADRTVLMSAQCCVTDHPVQSMNMTFTAWLCEQNVLQSTCASTG